jgi:C4-type Zn-finger protein
MAAPNLKNPTTITGRDCPVCRYQHTLGNALANSPSSGKVLKINSIFCANVDGTNPADISVSIYDGSD